MKILKNFFFPLFLFALVSGCDSNESTSDLEKKGDPTITIRLVDAPGDYVAVNIEIIDVMIKMDNDNDDDNGWTSLEVNDEIVNLLDFTGGFSKVLVEKFPIPAGTLSQMRLVLGDGNTIVIKDSNDQDETFDLKTPSGQQSGLKVKVNEEVEEGYTYDFIIDFDVEKSIVHAGNSGNIILKPVLYATLETSSGIIEGTIIPTDVPSKASVLIDDKDTPETEDDIVISAMTDENGAFALWGVPAGTYDVIVTPLNEDTDYSYGKALDVVVVNGEITTITDPIELKLKLGSITGKISGLADGVLATVSINDDAISSVVTDKNGNYLLGKIVPESYTVTVSATGYVTQNIDIVLEPNEDEVVNVTLVLVP